MLIKKIPSLKSRIKNKPRLSSCILDFINNCASPDLTKHLKIHILFAILLFLIALNTNRLPFNSELVVKWLFLLETA